MLVNAMINIENKVESVSVDVHQYITRLIHYYQVCMLFAILKPTTLRITVSVYLYQFSS